MSNDLISASKVYVVLVNWNSWGDTIECLESIYRSNYPNYQVIVVDNASADESLNKIAAWAKGKAGFPKEPSEQMKRYSSPAVQKPIPCVSMSLDETQQNDFTTPSDALILIQSGSNAGFGGGNNVAMSFISRRGDGDYMWLLNNDTVIEPDTISEMVETGKNTPGIVGSVVRYYSRPEKVQAFGGGYVSYLTGSARLYSKPPRKRLNFIFGASFMIDRAALEQLGLFDENIFMYYEEVEYCIRARQRGILMSFSHANVYHKVGASSRNRYFQWINIYKNRVYTMHKHFGVSWWVLFTALNWLTNIVSPFVEADKRRASRDAFAYLRECVFKPPNSSV